jgi:hypothetical protein
MTALPAPSPVHTAPGPKIVTLEIEFTVGTIEEIGIGGLKQPWVDSDHQGRHYSITAGAGLGNPLMEASIKDGDRNLYAHADMRKFAPKVFDMLSAALDHAALDDRAATEVQL